MLISLILQWIVAALILMLVAWLIPGISIEGFGIALLAVLILGLVNMLIKPLLTILTLPINILTLGLFSLVINAAMFALAAWVLPGFEVASFWSALFGALLLSILSAIVNSIPGRPGPAH